MHVVGAIDKETVGISVKDLERNWKKKKVEIPTYKTPARPNKSKVYFYDVPDAKQSVIYFGYPALANTDKELFSGNDNEL